MGLESSIEHESGVMMTYFRVLQAMFNFQSQTLDLYVSCFASKGAARAGKQSLGLKTLSIPFSGLTTDARSFLYPILTQATFSPLRGAAAPADEVGQVPAPSIPTLTPEAKVPPP